MPFAGLTHPSFRAVQLRACSASSPPALNSCCSTAWCTAPETSTSTHSWTCCAARCAALCHAVHALLCMRCAGLHRTVPGPAQPAQPATSLRPVLLAPAAPFIQPAHAPNPNRRSGCTMHCAARACPPRSCGRPCCCAARQWATTSRRACVCRTTSLCSGCVGTFCDAGISDATACSLGRQAKLIWQLASICLPAT